MPDLDIAAAGQSEFFTVNAPAGTTGTMTVTVQSKGLSLLAPKITVYFRDADRTGFRHEFRSVRHNVAVHRYSYGEIAANDLA